MSERTDASRWLVAGASQSVNFCHGLKQRAGARARV